MNRFDPCQLNAAIAVITNQLYCSLSRQDFVNLGVVLSMLSRSIINMAAIEELLKWEHRDLRAERLLKERETRRRQTTRVQASVRALEIEEELEREDDDLEEIEELIAAEKLAAEDNV